MIIRKYLHSCLLIEDKGKKLLIDPGAFSFIEGKVKPQDIGAVDVIVFTHNHRDHYDPEALRIILNKKSATVVAGEEMSAAIEADEFQCLPVRAGEVMHAAGFTLQAIEADHEALSTTLPENLGYLINNSFLHPGDSYRIKEVGPLNVLALPVAGPWALTDALEFAVRMRPETVIPIHDAGLKDFSLERVYYNCKLYFERHSIVFHPLSLDEMLEV